MRGRLPVYIFRVLRRRASKPKDGSRFGERRSTSQGAKDIMVSTKKIGGPEDAEKSDGEEIGVRGAQLEGRERHGAVLERPVAVAVVAVVTSCSCLEATCLEKQTLKEKRRSEVVRIARKEK